MKTKKLPPGWRVLASDEPICPGDRVDYNPLSHRKGRKTRTPQRIRWECSASVVDCQLGTAPAEQQTGVPADDVPMFFRLETPAVKGGEKAYAELVRAASALFRGAPVLPGSGTLLQEAVDAYLADPAPISDLSPSEADEAVALYFLTYAAAKRCGDL